jgi:tetratricopeptide (TPR) repeat protein
MQAPSFPKLTLRIILLIAIGSLAAQAQAPGPFRLVLSNHPGLLTWTADGFTITEASAKPNGQELGIRSEDKSGRIHSLGFLFLAAQSAPQSAQLTSASCRDQVLASDKKDNPTLTVLRTSEIPRGPGPSIALATYTAKGEQGLGYLVRGFIATADICGDLEFDSLDPISDQDPVLAKIFSTYSFDPAYKPAFTDVLQYAQVLVQMENYKAAAPTFDKALVMIPASGAPFASATVARRIVTDQAGIAYGMAGDLHKSRQIFETAITRDPFYPLYYYNLASVDAEQNDLPAARRHLQQAFARKANLNPGESMPDPTTSDSFLLFKDNKPFWTFLESLQTNKVTSPKPEPNK